MKRLLIGAVAVISVGGLVAADSTSQLRQSIDRRAQVNRTRTYNGAVRTLNKFSKPAFAQRSQYRVPATTRRVWITEKEDLNAVQNVSDGGLTLSLPKNVTAIGNGEYRTQEGITIRLLKRERMCKDLGFHVCVRSAETMANKAFQTASTQTRTSVTKGHTSSIHGVHGDQTAHMRSSWIITDGGVQASVQRGWFTDKNGDLYGIETRAPLSMKTRQATITYQILQSFRVNK